MNIELPTHPDAERLVLGRMMNSMNCANTLFENLVEEDFTLPEHRCIFKAGYSLFSKDRKIDATAILAELQVLFPEYADYSTVFGLQSYSYGMTNDFMQFVEIVRDHSIYRKTIIFSKEMMEAAATKKLSSEELKNKFLEESDLIFRTLNDSSIVSLKDVMNGNFRESGKTIFEYVEEKQIAYAKGENTISGYQSNYKILDDILEGFNKGHYIIIGARAGVGKTTFALNLMKRFIDRNLKVGFFSLEMSKEMITEKYISIDSGVDQKKVSRGGLTPDEFTRWMGTGKAFKGELIIDEQPNIRVSQFAARAKRMVLAYGVKIIFIDYLSEVKGDGRFSSKQEEIQSVSKGIRAVAKKLNIPIICLAQLNRENEKASRKPIKSDLRESGQIEADAYSIILLHRPEVDNSDDQPGKMLLRIVKNRLGKEADLDFSFDGKTGLIEEIGFSRSSENKTDVKDFVNTGATNLNYDPYRYFTPKVEE